MITVDQLASVGSLGLIYLAGERGGSRPVVWAHAVDLPDPWKWSNSGDLVMTTGGGIPVTEADQREWMKKLIDHDVSALVVAAGPSAPELSDGLLDVAESRGFPVLSASFHLHFVSLARTVIESSIAADRQRIATIQRLYDFFWQSLRSRSSFSDRLTALERVTGWSLDLFDLSTESVFASGASGENISAGTSGLTELQLPTAGEVILRAAPAKNPVSDKPLLEHIRGLISLELEYKETAADAQREAGRDLFAGLLDESLTLSAVWPELSHRGLGKRIVVACWRPVDGGTLALDEFHRQVWMHEYSPLLLADAGGLLGIVPGDEALLRRIGTAIGPKYALGISTPLALNSQVPEAVKQAQLAAARAVDEGSDVSRYGEDSYSGVFPQSVEDARGLVNKILGKLLEHDRETGGDLVRTLSVFLGNDGSWQKSADELMVHRQTLVYRLKKVQKLSGLSATSTEGSALFWLALEAAKRAELPIEKLGA